MKNTQAFLVYICLYAFTAKAQAMEVEMADALRAEGKIYIVVLVCLLVLFGLISYLVYLDKRISKLEKK